MSDITDLAELEAQRAESEPDDDDDQEPDDEDAPDDETTDEELDAEEPQEARGPSAAELKRFESENTRHERALGKIIGDDWSEFAACGACGGVGFAPAALVAYTALKRDPHTETCAVCDGEGATESGAKPRAQVEIPCNACGGKGWNRKAEQAEIQPTAYNEPTFAPAAPAPAPNGGSTDPRVAALQAEGFIVVAPVVAPPVA